ncbi:hypothetical protein ACIQPQ_34335 [Streptomyces sp. NPDC091281]|uniref:hypothetical protein n=1 Tax=Streptomyces sp. NPDC091281 TaxID=3365985 RepID=UPI00381838DE
MGAVWMRHPSLPPEQLIEVPEKSVPHHQSAGWEITEPPAPKPKLPPPTVPGVAEHKAAEDEPEGAASEDPAPEAEAATKPRRARRASTEES